MEERIIDDPRKIRIEQETGEGPAQEVELGLPEGDEYDEDLVGLSPSELERELARREKALKEAQAECEKLLSEGNRALSAGDYAAAEPYFSQALLYDPESAEGKKKLWECRSHGFRETAPLMNRSYAEEFAETDGETKAFFRGKLGDRLAAEREEAEAQASPLRGQVYEAQRERREAFSGNRSYYRARVIVFAVLLALFAAAALVSAQFFVRVNNNIPVIITIATGALAVLDLIPLALFSRKLIVAQRLCKENEQLSSTEEGEILEKLETKISIIDLYLND